MLALLTTDGAAVQVGIPGGNAQLTLPLQDLVFNQKTMAGCANPCTSPLAFTFVHRWCDQVLGVRGYDVQEAASGWANAPQPAAALK
jgi:hypothetical protein